MRFSPAAGRGAVLSIKEPAGRIPAFSPYGQEDQGDFEIDWFRPLLVFNFSGSFNSCFRSPAFASAPRYAVPFAEGRQRGFENRVTIRINTELKGLNFFLIWPFRSVNLRNS